MPRVFYTEDEVRSILEGADCAVKQSRASADPGSLGGFGMSMQSAQPPSRALEVTRELTELHEQIGKLQAGVEEFASRLMPVLDMRPKTEGGLNEAEPPTCTLVGGEVREAINRVKRIQITISGLHSALEL